MEEVIKELGLEDIEICDLDFRTFIRTMDADIDLFISRASLDPEELCRLFKPGCRYKNAILAYWASGQWEPSPAIEPLIDHIKTYSISSKRRKLVFFKKK